MNANLQVDLAAIHAAIVSDIQAQFPSLATVEFYREDRKSIPLPACLLTLEEMEREPEHDDGTGQIPMCIKFEAELIVGFRTPAAKLSVRVLAGAMASFINLRRWTGIKADPAMVIGCYKDDFSPELDQYEVQRVEWSQLCYLGATAWPDAPPDLSLVDNQPHPAPHDIQSVVKVSP